MIRLESGPCPHEVGFFLPFSLCSHFTDYTVVCFKAFFPLVIIVIVGVVGDALVECRAAC